MRFVILIFCLLFLQIPAHCQTVIKGRVVDQESLEPVGFATVFFDNSTLGTLTDDSGEFELRVLEGSHNLVISRLDYELFSFLVDSRSLSEFYEFRIQATPIELQTVDVISKRGPEWRRGLEDFTRYFIGTSINGLNTKIENPEVLIIDRDSETQNLRVFTRQPLLLSNNNLGYRIEYSLISFELDFERQEVGYLGYALFKEESMPDRKKRRVEKRREKAYEGSLMHFFRSVYHGELEENGFEVYAVQGDGRALSEARLTGRKAPEPLMEDDFIEKASSKVFYTFPDPLWVVYKKEKPEQRYINERSEALKQKGVEVKNSSFQESWIMLKSKAIQVFSEGNYYHPLDLQVEGYMGWEKIADLVPLDYGL
jgi:hypothetical protein